MNLELMKAVSAAIKAHPHHFNMSEWYRHGGGSLDNDSCGTRACLAGWTLHCAGAEDAVRALLGTGRVPAAAPARQLDRSQPVRLDLKPLRL